MSRPVDLIVYNSPLFAAHWSLFIPNSTNPDKGKIIHVTGDSLNGFTHQFKRNYDLKEEDRPMTFINLCNTEAKIVDHLEAGYVEDTEAMDGIEECALSVPAPGRSLRAVGGGEGIRRKVELKTCQTWMREFVVVGIERGFFPAEAVVELDKAPKN